MMEVREAYLLWVAENKVDGKPRTPAAVHEFEWVVFFQGFLFGQMSDEDFVAVVERLHADQGLGIE